MKVYGKYYRTIWPKLDDNKIIRIINQTKLPHKFEIEDLKTVDDMAHAIKDLHVRGAGLIGASAGYGMYLAALNAPDNKFDDYIHSSGEKLIATRPTAINLKWAVHRQIAAMSNGSSNDEKKQIAFNTANKIANEDVQFCKQIGEHGLRIIEHVSALKNGEPVNILTHCNAGWLAFVDYGSATSPIYAAHEKGIKVHVWVDETRPHNKGIRLTAWELTKAGVPNTTIVDNVGGHLMQHRMVDMVLVGTDRTTYTGFVANQIGTYLKALAAKDNNIPFYVALPSSTFDWELEDGFDIPIEERDENDTTYVEGLVDEEIKKVLLAPKLAKAATYVFDVTPPRLVTSLITERGICRPNKESILKLFPEKKKTNE
jgi:methylthioribose-1-phosphate isomerase